MRSRPRDEVKFVIASRRDYEFARDFIQEQRAELASRFGDSFACIPQGCGGKLAMPRIAWWIRSSLPSGCWRTG